MVKEELKWVKVETQLDQFVWCAKFMDNRFMIGLNDDCLVLYKNTNDDEDEHEIMSWNKNVVDSIEVPAKPEDKTWDEYMEQLKQIVNTVMNWAKAQQQ